MALETNTQNIRTQRELMNYISTLDSEVNKKEIQEAILQFKQTQQENNGGFEFFEGCIKDDQIRLDKLTAQLEILEAQMPTLKKVSTEKFDIFQALEKYFKNLSKEDEGYKSAMEQCDSAHKDYMSSESNIRTNLSDQIWYAGMRVPISFDIAKNTKRLNFLKAIQNKLFNK